LPMVGKMIDHPLQFVLSVIIIVISVVFLWRTRRSRLERPPTGWRRSGRTIARIALMLVVLIVLLIALDATRYMKADVCLELNPGSEWCLYDDHDAADESDE